MSLQVGQVIEEKYRILRLIGQGGMGAVFEGENVLIHRRVAIKVLLAGRGNLETMQRFEREAQAAGRIGSDHILEVLDLGTLPGGERFIVMEYLDGESLGARITRSARLTPEQIAPLVRQVLRGLIAAHAAGIIHRDLKPENVFILREKAGQPDFVKLIDFGVSKFAALGQQMDMTRTGAVVGTPYYMSPEQAQGSTVADVRNDLYAVGVILFEAVTGHVPYEAATFNELLFKIVLAPPPAPRALVPELNPAFAALIEKAMAKLPEQRYQSSAEMLHALEAWMHGRFAQTPGGTHPLPPLSTLAMSNPPHVHTRPGSFAGPAPAAAVPGRNTTDSWAKSRGGSSAPPSRSGGALAATAIGVIALLAIGGGAFGAYRYMHRGGAPASSSASGPSIVPSDLPAATASAPVSAPAIEDAGVAIAIDAATAQAAAAPSAPPAQSATAAQPARRTPSRTVPSSTGTGRAKSNAAPASTTPDFGY